MLRRFFRFVSFVLFPLSFGACSSCTAQRGENRAREIARSTVRNMGVLLVSDGTAAVQPRMNLNAVKATGAQRAIDIDNEANNNVNGLRDANSLMPTQVVGIIDVVVNDEPVRSWMPPPPKKKWIRHYLLGEANLFVSRLSLSPVDPASSVSFETRVFFFFSSSV